MIHGVIYPADETPSLKKIVKDLRDVDLNREHNITITLTGREIEEAQKDPSKFTDVVGMLLDKLLEIWF